MRACHLTMQLIQVKIHKVPASLQSCGFCPVIKPDEHFRHPPLEVTGGTFFNTEQPLTQAWVALLKSLERSRFNSGSPERACAQVVYLGKKSEGIDVRRPGKIK